MKTRAESLADIYGPPISTYSRAEALEDGVLVDVSEWAGTGPYGFHGGFSCPVDFTRAVWDAVEAIPKSLSHQDVRGRAHDVLWMASLAARRGGSEARFRVILPSAGTRKRLRELVLRAGPGDDGELVLTIGFPEDF